MSNIKNIVFRRKKKFINAKSQISFAFWLTLYQFAFFALILMVMFLPPLSNILKPEFTDPAFIGKGFLDILLAKWPFVILILVVMIFFANLFSHRVVGPAYRFKEILKSLLEKNLDIRFKLRKWDYHKELEPLFKGYINDLKEDVESVKNKIKEAQDALDQNQTDKVKKSLETLKAEFDKYKY